MFMSMYVFPYQLQPQNVFQDNLLRVQENILKRFENKSTTSIFVKLSKKSGFFIF